MELTALQKWFIEFDKKHFSKDPKLDRKEQLKEIAHELAFPHNGRDVLPNKQIPSSRKEGETKVGIFNTISEIRPENEIFRYHLLDPLMCASYSDGHKMKNALRRVIPIPSSEEGTFNYWIRENQNFGNKLDEVIVSSFQKLLFHPGNFLSLHIPFFSKDQFLGVLNNSHQLPSDIKKLPVIQNMQVRALNELLQQNLPYAAISRVLSAAHLNQDRLIDSLTYLYIPYSESDKDDFKEHAAVYSLARCAFGLLTSHVGYFPQRSELKTQGFEQLIQEKNLCDEILKGDNIPDVMRHVVREMERGAKLDISLFEQVKVLELQYQGVLEKIGSLDDQEGKIEALEKRVAKLTAERNHYRGENEEMHSMYTDREKDIREELNNKMRKERQDYRHLRNQKDSVQEENRGLQKKLQDMEEETTKLNEELHHLQQEKIIQEIEISYTVDLHPKVHEKANHHFFQHAIEKAKEILARVPFDQESKRYATPINGHKITIGIHSKYGKDSKIYRPTPHVRIIYSFKGENVHIKDVLNHTEYERLGHS